MQKKGLTADDVASRIPSSRTNGHISVSALNQHIQGNPSVEVMEKIALALDVPLWQLFVSTEEAKGVDVDTEFCAFIRRNGIHYTADSEAEFWKIVDELRMVAGHQD